jgi:hypothetical protein
MKMLSIGLITLGLTLTTPSLAEEIEWTLRIMNGQDDNAATLAAQKAGEEIDWALALASAALPCESHYQFWDA